MTEVVIRHLEQDDDQPVISVVDSWWGGRPMAAMPPKLFFVHFLGVHPARRGEGLGRLLYGHVFTAAASHGCRTAQCVTAPVNCSPIAFHRRLGFSLLGSDDQVDGAPFTKELDTLDTVRCCPACRSNG